MFVRVISLSVAVFFHLRNFLASRKNIMPDTSVSISRRPWKRPCQNRDGNYRPPLAAIVINIRSVSNGLAISGGHPAQNGKRARRLAFL